MRSINGIKQTLFATFPRSGHHVMQRVCHAYFGDRLHWCDIHKCGDQGFIKNPKFCNMEKNHDFDLDVPIRQELQHVIQIRHPIFAIAGWKAMHQREGKVKRDWRPWCQEKMNFYSKFCTKWLYTSVPNRLVVPYERLVVDPVKICSKVIEFMLEDPDELDTDRIEKIVAEIQIKPQELQQVPFEFA